MGMEKILLLPCSHESQPQKAEGLPRRGEFTF